VVGRSRNGYKKGENNAMVLLCHTNIKISHAADVAKLFQELLTLEDAIDQDKEHFYVCHVDSHNRITMIELVAIGTLTYTAIHPRETFRRAVIEGSYSILVAHNHPSGDVTPSESDIAVTERLQKAGALLIIPLLDHIIFTPTTFYSFLKNKKQSSMITQA
jgi:DNA repair protein RadC